jgi:hypothetical protein
MPHCCPENVAQGDYLMVNRVASWPHGLAGLWMLAGTGAMHSILLHQSRRDFSHHLIAEERQQVAAETQPVALHINWTSLTGR